MPGTPTGSDPTVEAAIAQLGRQQPAPLKLANFMLDGDEDNVFIVETEPDEAARSDTSTVERFYAEHIEILNSGYLLFRQRAFVKDKLVAENEGGIRVNLSTRAPLDLVLLPMHQVEWVGVVDREDWMKIGPAEVEGFLEWIVPRLDPDTPVEKLYSEFLSTNTADNGGEDEG